MAGFKFFNIGKANAEIDRLNAEIATLKASAPATADATQLADALASNDQISTQLIQANADLATAKQTISTQSDALGKANGDLAAMNTALKTACASLKLEVAEASTGLDKITALQNGVASTLAKLNVAPEKIPAGKPGASSSASENTKTVAQWRAMNPAEAAQFFKGGGKLVD